MSAGAWQDLRHVWTAATTWRDGRMCEWSMRAALFAALAAGMARLAGVLEREAFWKLELGIALLWFGVLWVMLFIPASILMNSAANARLVPRQRARLLQIAAGGWLLLVGGATLVFGDPVLFPVVAAYVLGFMLLRGGVRQGVILFVVAPNWPLLSRRVLPAPLVQAVTSPRGLLVVSIVMVLLTAWYLLRLYPAGGDRHLDGRAQRISNIRRFEMREAAIDKSGSWLARLFYGPALGRDCRAPKADAMLLHALGPGAHWSVWIMVPIIVSIAALALQFFPLVFGNAATHSAKDWMLGFSMSTMNIVMLFSCAHFAQLLRKTPAEQALLRLTPLAGDARLLNARLAGGLLKVAVLNCAMLAGSLLVLAWAIGGSVELMLQDFGISCLFAQIALGGLLRDYAKQLPHFRIVHLARMLPLAVVEAALAYGLSRLGGSMWGWLAAIGIVGCAVQVALTRRRMLAAPPAFPAGRME